MHGFNIKGGRHFIFTKVIMVICTIAMIVCLVFAYVDNLSAPEKKAARKEVFESKIGGVEGAVQAAVAMVENEYIDRVTAIYRIIIHRRDNAYMYEVQYLSGIIPKSKYYYNGDFTTKETLESFEDRSWDDVMGRQSLRYLDLTMVLEEAQKCL